MNTFTLKRTGDAPLRFVGEQLAEATSQAVSGYRQNRYHTISIYRAQSGQVVASIEFESRWKGEDQRQTVFVADEDGAIIDFLRQYDPCDDYFGFPDGGAYVSKQERLDTDIRRGYEIAVSEALGAANLVEDVDEFASLRRHRDERRYRALLSRALKSVHLSVPEASLICDALNGHDDLSLFDRADEGHDPGWGFWRASVEDHVRINGAAEKWGVDWPALAAKLSSLDELQQLAIADAVERWWCASDRDTTADSLAAVGLVGQR